MGKRIKKKTLVLHNIRHWVLKSFDEALESHVREKSQRQLLFH